MIKKIYIDGYRHFKNFVFEPYERSTLLCGLNGTGKTTIVEIINKIQLFLINNLSVMKLCGQSDIPAWEIKEYGSASTIFEIEIQIDNNIYNYHIAIKYNFKDSICRVEREILKCNDAPLFSSKNGNAEVITDDNRSFSYPVDWNFTGLMVAKRNSSKIRSFLSVIHHNLFSISLNPFIMSSEHQDKESILNLDGANFSAWYDYLRDQQMAVIVDVFNKIKPFVPGFRQFSFISQGKRQELTVDFSPDTVQNYRLSFEKLSHGQKILCLLYLLIYTAPNNSTIVIDEFENFLSYVELQPIYNATQDVQEEKDIQFIFVSHHEKTMNWFQDSTMILFLMGAPAFVAIKPFAEENMDIPEYLSTLEEE